MSSTITTTCSSTPSSRNMSSGSSNLSGCSPGTSLEMNRLSNHLQSLHPHHVDIFEHQPSPPSSFCQQKYRHFYVPPSALNLSSSPITSANICKNRTIAGPISSTINGAPTGLVNQRVNQRSASSSSVCNSASRDTCHSECGTIVTSSMGTPLIASFINQNHYHYQQQQSATTLTSNPICIHHQHTNHHQRNIPTTTTTTANTTNKSNGTCKVLFCINFFNNVAVIEISVHIYSHIQFKVFTILNSSKIIYII